MAVDTSTVIRARRLPRKSGFAYLDDGPPGGVLAMAHRGGALLRQNRGRENTLFAFQQAAALGFTYLETDVHATRDGVLMAFHDHRLDRVTDHTGAIEEMHSSEVATARIAGTHSIPTMAQLLEELPEARFNIDLKSDAAVQPLVTLIERHGCQRRVLIGSFSHRRLRKFRTLTAGTVPTSASPPEVAAFRLSPSGRLSDATTGHQFQALQVPAHQGKITVVTRGFLRRAHAAGKHVHVWTVDDRPEMERLLNLGVDGLISDRIDILRDVLHERGLVRSPA